MNKKSLVLALTVAGALTSINALANPATTNFEGTVSDPTCTMTTESLSHTVVMNDITVTSITAAANPSEANANALFLNIKGVEVAVPAINFVNCPDTATEIQIFDMNSSGIPATSSQLYWLPETGAARGLALGIAGKNANGGYTLCNDSTGGETCSQNPDAVSYPVADGSATTGADGIKIFAYRDPYASVIRAGDYATTFTLTFAWE